MYRYLVLHSEVKIMRPKSLQAEAVFFAKCADDDDSVAGWSVLR